PKAIVFAILINPNNPNADADIEGLQAAARSAGLELIVVKAATGPGLEIAFGTLVRQRAEGLIIGDDPFLITQREQIVALAAHHAVPTVYFSREVAESGPDELWHEHCEWIPSSRHLYWTDSQGREASRLASLAADQVRVDHQPQDRQGARPRSAADAARASRRGHRIEIVAAMHESAFGTKRTCPSCRSTSAFGGKADIVGSSHLSRFYEYTP